jgi:ribosomal protein S18 acetylase RimI-like enzyme
MTAQTTDTAINYRSMTEGDLAGAYRLSLAVRWPHRLEDWQFVHRLGIGFVAEENGALIGTALCWKYGKEHASLGMIIVSPEHQGKGIGRELMTQVLDELGNRCTLLNATPAGQPLYERLGFVPTGTIHQHQGTMLAAAPVALAAGERLRMIEPVDLPALAALASRALGMPRDGVLASLLDIAEGVVLERDGEAIGFSLMRRFGRGHVIGPVVASDSGLAKVLIAHWAAAYAGSFVRIDVTGMSGLGQWVSELGLAQVDTGVSMMRGALPRQDESIRQFAIINQALC